MSIFEALMMLCLGAAWPLSIYNSVKSRSTKGKSLLFLCILILGYIFGILNKLIYRFDYSIFLYSLNLIMVCIDTILWLKNRKEEKEREEKEREA